MSTLFLGVTLAKNEMSVKFLFYKGVVSLIINSQT